MSAPEAPSLWRVVRLIVGLELRRWHNLSSFRKPSKVGRTGTARKRAPARMLLLFVSVVLGFNVLNNTTRLIYLIAVDAEQRSDPTGAFISQESLDWLDQIVTHSRPTGTLWVSERTQVSDLFEVVSRDEHAVRASDRPARLRELLAVYDRRGRAGFHATRLENGIWPSPKQWYFGAARDDMLAPLTAIASLFVFSALTMIVLGSERDLARSDEKLEWWSTFPVPTRALLFARALGAALVAPFAWLIVLPFFCVVFWCAGWGYALGTVAGLLAALYVLLLGGSLRIACETTIRRFLLPRHVARVQAALELVSGLSLAFAIFASSTPRGLAYLLAQSHALPRWCLFSPLALPLSWLREPGTARLGWLATSALPPLALFGATSLGSAMLRRGLSIAREAVQGTRRNARALGGGRASLFAVTARRELMAMAREPSRLVRVLLSPFVMLATLLLTTPGAQQSIITEPQHAAATAFSLGCFSLIGSGVVSLANEGPGLWLLYTAPHSLASVLMRRAWLWSLFGGALGVLTLIVLASVAHDPSFLFSGHAVLALVGIGLYGLISVPLGALGTDVQESSRAQRLQPLSPQLFLLLASMFAFALYVPSLWAKFAQLSLSSLFAFALWQKLRDHIPYWLDPTEEPPPRIAVSDGIFAALAFFVLQGLFGFLFVKAGLRQGMALLFAFASAGSLVSIAGLYALHRMGVPSVQREVGLRAEGARPVQALVLGVGAGVVAGACSLAYAAALHHVEWLHTLQEEAEQLDPTPSMRPWIAVLAVVAAPLFEEFIFRGILYRGFRRSLSPLRAALASALVFAVVHPPLAFAPVFVMALFAAAVFERTRLLLAPIATHATYNAIVVSLWLAQQS